MCQSLNQAQQLAQLQIERYQALADELLLKGAYIIDIPGDGDCQFNSVKFELIFLLQTPETAQSMRIKVVEHMRDHEDIFKEMQKSTFIGEEKEFRDAVFLAYPNFDFDTYCELMLNPTGVQSNCDGGGGSGQHHAHGPGPHIGNQHQAALHEFDWLSGLLHWRVHKHTANHRRSALHESAQAFCRDGRMLQGRRKRLRNSRR